MGTRHERVIVDLDDRFSRGMAGMSANTSLFKKNIGDADRQLLVFDKHTQDVGRNIDKLSGRLGLFIDLAATLGPSLIPATTALLPLMSGLTNQLGFAAIAGGSTILAFQGVGDALKAVNEQAVNPSTANLEKMHEAMAKLGPAGRDFVRELQSLRPEMQKLQDSAQAGLFPGMTEGIESLMTRMPAAERIITEVTDGLGDLLADAGESLSGPQWDEFFSVVESEARPTMMALGESIGQVTKGLAELWIAFAPLNRDFSQGMLEASRSFAEWADGLSQTQGFADFMAYLEETGPQVASTLGSLGSALLDVLEAAAPLGGPALAAIKGFSEAISAIANSDIGTPLLAAVAAMRAFSLASTVAGKATSTVWGTKAQSQVKSYGGSLLGVVSAQERANTAAGQMARTTAMQRTALLRGAAGAAALGLATTGMADSIGLSNTAMLGLTGFMVGGGVGAAFGTAAGAVLDLTHANDGLNDSLAQLSAMAGKVDFGTFNAQLAQTKKQVDDLSHVTGVGDALSDTFKTFGGALSGGGGFLEQRGKARNELKAAELTQQTAGRNAGSAAATKAYAQAQLAASRLAAQGFQLTAAGAREAAMSVEQFTFSMRGATAALERQSNWDTFRGAVLDAKDAVASAGKTLQKNGDIIRGQGRDMQRAGLESRGLLRNIAAQAIQTSQGMKDIGNRTKFLGGARRSFIQVAQSMGISRQAARALADQLGLVSRIKVTPKVKLEGVGPALSSAAQVSAALSRIPRNVTSTIRVTRTGAVGGSGHANAQAYGGLYTAGGVRHYAYGDVANRHMPELAGPGQTRVWREPETQGEAYIPLANDDRRPRARAIAAETVSLLGGTAYFADGGINARRGRGGDDGHHVDRFTKALRAATRALEKEKTVREGLISKRTELSSSVRDNFLGDPFEGDTNVWAKGAGDPRATLKADISRANNFRATLMQLKKNGLDGSALAAIASTGDVGKARALLSLGKTGIGQYESLYKQRAVAASTVGAYAGGAVYNSQIAASNKELREIRNEIRHLRHESRGHARETGREAAKGVNRGAAAARRNRR